MRIDPENPFTYNALGASYAQLRNWSTAASLYAKAIQLNPAYAAAYFNRGVAYYNAGRYDLAVQDFSWAVDQERDDPLALALRGKAYFSLLDSDHAKEDFDHALTINASDYVSLIGRGRVHFRQGRFRDSITDLSSSIKIRPTAQAYEIRSQAFRALGQMAQSQPDYQAALRLQPQ